MTRFEEHLEHCERCTAELRFEANVLRQVRAKVGRVRAPSGLLGRISRALEAIPDEGEGA